MAQRAVDLSPGDAEARRLLEQMTSPMTPEGWVSLNLAEYQSGRYGEFVDAA